MFGQMKEEHQNEQEVQDSLDRKIEEMEQGLDRLRGSMNTLQAQLEALKRRLLKRISDAENELEEEPSDGYADGFEAMPA